MALAFLMPALNVVFVLWLTSWLQLSSCVLEAEPREAIFECPVKPSREHRQVFVVGLCPLSREGWLGLARALWVSSSRRGKEGLLWSLK